MVHETEKYDFMFINHYPAGSLRANSVAHLIRVGSQGNDCLRNLKT